MLDRVGEGLGDDVVDADLELFGQPPFDATSRSTGMASVERAPSARAETILGEYRGVDAAGHLAQLIQGASETSEAS